MTKNGKWNATRIRQLRQRLDMTQQQFAVRLGIAINTVSRWEAGVRAPHAKLSVPILDALEAAAQKETK
jgi:DNA-binding transcriptional regulator YiaG